MVGIVGYGTYLPRYRIRVEEIAKVWGSRGRGEKSVNATDEDAITMAVEAGLNAIQCSGIDPSTGIDAIYLATDSSPYIEQSPTGRIKEVLGMGAEVDIADFMASPRASIAALKASVDAIETKRVKNSLILGADCRPAEPGSDLELTFGVGAGALVLGTDGIMAEVEDIYTYSTAFVDRWRGRQDDFVRSYDYRFTREYGYVNHVVSAVNGLLKKMGATIEQFQHVVLQEPDGRVPREAAAELGIKKEQISGSIFGEVGDTGASSVLIGLAAVLERAKPGERILAVSYGSGTSDALSFVVLDEIDKNRGRRPSLECYLKNKEYIDYPKYMRFTGFLRQSGEELRLPVPPTSPYMMRGSAELYTLMGAKCTRCGFINFPPSMRKICVRCGGTELEQVRVSKRGRVYTYCINYYMPPPLEAPLPLIFADLHDGPRYEAMGTEMRPEDVKIGMEVELVLRRLTVERGVSVYGYKFRPSRGID